MTKKLVSFAMVFMLCVSNCATIFASSNTNNKTDTAMTTTENVNLTDSIDFVEPCATTGVKNVYRTAVLHSSLKITYSVTGKYYKKNNKKKWWTAVTNVGASVKATNAPWFYQIEKVYYNKATLHNKKKLSSYIKQKTKIKVGVYIGVKGFGVKINEMIITGTRSYYGKDYL